MIMCAAAQVLRITLVVLGLLVAAVVRCHGQAVPMDTTISSDNSTSTVSTSASTEAALMTESATSPSPGPPPDPPNSTLTAAVPSAAPTAPTTPTPSPTSGMVDHSPSPKSRALNLTEPPLDDVSMDDDMEDEIDENKSMSNMSRCMPGETFERSCDETCTCEDGGVSCRPRAACVAPYVRPQPDSACHQMPSDHDPCCVLMHCPDKPEGESPKMNNKCNYKNETYKVGETFNDACEATCTCEDTLHVSCKPRCEPVKNTTSDSCVAVPDSSDPCCTVVLCDVSVQDHDVTKPGSTGPEDGSEEMGEFQLLSAIAVNSTSVKLNSSMKLSGKNWSVEVSEDDTTWRPAMATQGSTVLGLEPGKTYHIRVKIDGKTSNAVSVTLPIMKKVGSTCEYKGKNYTRGDEFHDGCSAFCICSKTGVECATIECPTDFGLDVLDPHCLAWETQPSNFVPNPPNCCPETVRCKDNGSCIYAGESFPNWADIPTKLTGCEQRCFCEMGNVTCHAACPPVPANPPADLPCMPEQAILTHPPGEDCCLYWLCPQHPHGQKGDERLMKNETLSKDRQNDMTNTTTIDQHPFLGPYNPDNPSKTMMLDKSKTTKDQQAHKKDFFPGPFSIQHLQEKANKSGVAKMKTQPDHNYEHLIEDTIWPFHIDKQAAKENAMHMAEVLNKTMHNMKPVQEESKPSEISDSAYEDVFPNNNEGVIHHPILPPGALKPTKPGKEHKHHQILWSTFPDESEQISHDIDQDPRKPLKPESDYNQKKPHSTKGNNVPPHNGPLFVEHGNKSPDQFHNGEIDHQNQHYIHPGPIHFINQQHLQPNPNVKHPQGNAFPISNPQNPFVTHDKQQKMKDVGTPSQDLLPFGRKPSHVFDGHFPPDELLTHLQNLPQNHNNAQNKPSHLPPEEIFHIIQQQNQYQHPGDAVQNNNHYFNPQDVFVVEHQDKLPGDKGQYIVNQHGSQKPGPTIHIHSPSIPSNPNLRVEEILTHIRQQEEKRRQQFVHTPPQHGFVQQRPVNEHPIRPIPILHPHPSDLQPQHSNSPILLGHQLSQNSSLQGFNPQHLPPGFTQNSAQDPNEIKVHTLEAIDESTVRLVFSVPSVLVGLHGRVELRYTADKQNSDPATWEQQVLAPPNDLIATPELEFSLGNLQPDTSYKIKISVILRDLENSPASKILTVKTPSSATTLPPMIPVQPELQIAELNSTWARLVWRKFTDFELQFIDGVQLRYKEVDGKVYAATPLIHRAVTSYVLEGLKPDSHYEVGIFFIPFPGQTTELTATNVLQLSTAIENDPYKFELSLDVHHIKASSVELSWSGVPYPEDKFVNIFRAIYQSEGGREDFNNFKVAKRDSPPSTLIKGLKPNTRYRIWLEAYLTNGRIKKSNVKDFTTKLGPAAVDDAHPGKLEGMPLVEANDYYGPLIAVSILAALAIVAVLILLLILAKKHGHNKAPITAANTRKVQSAAYDNPSYKTCENDTANGRTEMSTMNVNLSIPQ
ncbi:putative epidermal cell surface receptor isoform X2 [Nilaparvata lugens]|uniref:putative epidermal cell surface receptor isoform X2 n=1 Tax=Nilaparvata lugens TaxID=108931 RepID=UPI00193CD75D|nr:putative epidermal cell surface receptor isoform X2 [Nilaparvata lugens]